MDARQDNTNKRRSTRESIPLQRQQTGIIKLDPAAMLSLAVKTIMLENPRDTTHFAHDIDSESINQLLTSATMSERLFAHICLFACAKFETANDFSKLFLSYMQTLNLNEAHSQICIYLYDTAAFYMPKPFANADQLEKRYRAHQASLKRSKQFLTSNFQSDLEASCYAWLCDINDVHRFVIHDIAILKMIVEQLTKRAVYSPIVDCMIGHVLARNHFLIPSPILSEIESACAKSRREPINSAKLIKALMWGGNTLSMQGASSEYRKIFELTKYDKMNKMHLELPNTCVKDAANIIATNPALLVECWIELKDLFWNLNLQVVLTNNPQQFEALLQSDNREVQVVMEMHELNLNKRLLTRSYFEKMLGKCSERLILQVINKCYEIYTNPFSKRYDAELHALMTAVVIQYIESGLDISIMKKKLDSMVPVVSYSEQVAHGYEAAKTSFIAYATPVAASLTHAVSTQFAGLFSHPTDNKPIEPVKSPQHTGGQ